MVSVSPGQQAQAARGQIEDALDADVRRWRWSLRLSPWVDVLVILEEAAP